MTDEERRQKYRDTPTSELLKQLFIVLGQLIIACIQWALRQVLKGIVWCIKKIVEGCEALVDFWNSSDTQEKKKKLIAATKKGIHTFGCWCVIAWNWTKKYSAIGAKLAWKYTVKGSKLFIKYLGITILAIWAGTIWTITTIKDLIIHSKPTFIRLGKDIRQGSINLWHWAKRMVRGIRLRHIRRKRAWKNFRRTKGFKGLMIDMGKGMANGVTSFMEEEQSETDPEAITEDDIIAEEIEERQGKAKIFGQKFFKGMKDIVEEK